MILYKKDTKGKIRQLEIYAEWGMLYQYSGLVDWKQVEHAKQCDYKNKWKANERNPIEQSEFEADALITKKLREWYFKTIEEAENEIVILPMLAHSYDKYKDKIDYDNCYVQPKLDGMRCLAIIKDGKCKLMSRKGVEIETMNHIVKVLEDNVVWDMILDWELYCHGQSFQENMKLIKKYRKDKSELVSFHIYDAIDKNPYFIRAKIIKWINKLEYIENVPTRKIENVKELSDVHWLNLELWYEWTMIRHGIKGYKKNGRSDQLLKYKDFIDETFEVTWIIPMEVYKDQGIIICKMERERHFLATPKMSHEERRELLKNKDDYIGQTAEVRFFEYTDDGFPRFPICVWFRLDK